jgi:hypothetical protein
MVEDLHRTVWNAYRGAMRANPSCDASAAFQMAVDVLLARHPEIAAEPACRLAARMITLAPRGGRPSTSRGSGVEIQPTIGPVAGVDAFLDSAKSASLASATIPAAVAPAQAGTKAAA